MKVFRFWTRVSSKFDRIKQDPQKCEKSVSFGVTSIILSIVGIAFTVGFAVLAYLCLAGMNTLAFFFAFLATIICALTSLACYVNLVLASIVYAIYQMRLNKKPIGKVALIISLLISIGTIIVIIVALSQF